MRDQIVSLSLVSILFSGDLKKKILNCGRFECVFVSLRVLAERRFNESIFYLKEIQKQLRRLFTKHRETSLKIDTFFHRRQFEESHISSSKITPVDIKINKK